MNKYNFISQSLGFKSSEKIISEYQCCICNNNYNISKNKIKLSGSFTTHSDLSNIESNRICTACEFVVSNMNNLRHSSFICYEDEIKYIKREEIERYLFQNKKTPFIFAVNFSYQKHTIFYTQINYDIKDFIIGTDDKISISFSIDYYIEYWKIMKELYKIFSKVEIEHSSNNLNRIKEYGIDKYLEHNKLLNKIRTDYNFKILLFALNKEL